jgi:hypothetical protein
VKEGGHVRIKIRYLLYLFLFFGDTLTYNSIQLKVVSAGNLSFFFDCKTVKYIDQSDNSSWCVGGAGGSMS